MPTFALKEVSEIQGRIRFIYLMVNGVSEFEEFEKELLADGGYESELNTIQALMQQISDMRGLLPKTKFRDITPAKERVKEYEIKTRNLRVYLIHEEKTGRIIITGGKKTTQKKNIRHIRQLKAAYLKQKAS